WSSDVCSSDLLFPKDYHAETQVMIQLMSHDESVMPDALAGLAASAAIQLSDVPFETPISEVRVARVNGEFIINPSREQLEEADIRSEEHTSELQSRENLVCRL